MAERIPLVFGYDSGSPVSFDEMTSGDTIPAASLPAVYVPKNEAITPGTGTKITYDANGLVTKGENATQDDIGDGVTYKRFSATEQSKLSGIAEGAEVNVNADWSASSGDAQILNKPTSISGYGITDAYTKTEIDNKIASVYKYKGSVATYAGLPTEDLVIGDVYNVTNSGVNYAWTGTEWDDIGGVEALATAVNNGLMTKEDFSKLAGIEAGADVTDSGNVGSAIHSVDADTLEDASELPFYKTALKKITWANIKATLKTYFDTIYTLANLGGIAHSLATAADDFLVASGAGTFTKKTLAETLTILGKGAASGLATLNGSSLVVENPANATSTATASKIPIADGSGKLDTWISDATTSTKGKIATAGNAKAIAGTDTASAVTPDDLKYVLDRRIQQHYGVSWNESADTYVRTGSTAGQTCGVTLADAFLPVHRRMRGCLVADDGTVNYYLCATDWAYKEGPAYATGTITSDGTIPSDGDTVTIGNKTYTFKSALTPTEGEVLIAGSAAAAMTNLMRAITYTGTPNTDYKCAAHHTQVNASYDSLVVTVVSLLGGTVGNGYALSTTDANIAVSAAFMAGGAVNAASDLTGTDGQVMVEIPKFWYRYGYSGTTHTWEVSPVPLAGFKVHEAFLSDTTEKDYLYVGAYEACLYDVSASKYVGQCRQTSVSAVFATSDDSITIATRTGWATALAVGQKLIIGGTANNNGTVTVKTIESATKITVDENLTDETAATTVIQTQTDVTATTGDKLSSVSGVCPITGGSANGTRAHFRVYASNRGTGWTQLFSDADSAVQLLYLTEYASFYSQSVLGYGIAALSSATWTAYNDSNPIAKSGNGNAIGNISGCTATSAITTGAGATSVYLKYRGLENYYGHIWKWRDGFNVNNNIPYICNNPANFADNTASNYTNPTDANGTAITMINADGDQSTLETCGRAFMPAAIGSDSSHKITDYYYQSSGWRVALVGGAASYSGVAGFFCLLCTVAPSHTGQSAGGRLVFRK